MTQPRYASPVSDLPSAQRIYAQPNFSWSPTSNSLPRHIWFSSGNIDYWPLIQPPDIGLCTAVFAHVSPVHGQKKNEISRSQKSNYFMLLPIPINIVKHHLTCAQKTHMVTLEDRIRVWPAGIYFREKRGTKCQKGQKHVGRQTKSGLNGFNASLEVKWRLFG